MILPRSVCVWVSGVSPSPGAADGRSAADRPSSRRWRARRRRAARASSSRAGRRRRGKRGHERLGQQPDALGGAPGVAPERPEPEPGQEHRPVEDRAEKAHPGRVALGIVGAGEDPVMLQVCRPVGVAALQQDQPRRNSAHSVWRRFRPSVPCTTSCVTVTTATKIRKTITGVSHHRPSAQPAHRARRRRTGGPGRPSLARRGHEQVVAQLAQGGQARIGGGGVVVSIRSVICGLLTQSGTSVRSALDAAASGQHAVGDDAAAEHAGDRAEARPGRVAGQPEAGHAERRGAWRAGWC